MERSILQSLKAPRRNLNKWTQRRTNDGRNAGYRYPYDKLLLSSFATHYESSLDLYRIVIECERMTELRHLTGRWNIICQDFLGFSEVF